MRSKQKIRASYPTGCDLMNHQGKVQIQQRQVWILRKNLEERAKAEKRTKVKLQYKGANKKSNKNQCGEEDKCGGQLALLQYVELTESGA